MVPTNSCVETCIVNMLSENSREHLKVQSLSCPCQACKNSNQRHNLLLGDTGRRNLSISQKRSGKTCLSSKRRSTEGLSAPVFSSRDAGPGPRDPCFGLSFLSQSTAPPLRVPSLFTLRQGQKHNPSLVFLDRVLGSLGVIVSLEQSPDNRVPAYKQKE